MAASVVCDGVRGSDEVTYFGEERLWRNATERVWNEDGDEVVMKEDGANVTEEIEEEEEEEGGECVLEGEMRARMVKEEEEMMMTTETTTTKKKKNGERLAEKAKIKQVAGIAHEFVQLVNRERNAAARGDEEDVLAAVRAQASRVMLHVGRLNCHVCKVVRQECFRPRKNTCRTSYDVVKLKLMEKQQRQEQQEQQQQQQQQQQRQEKLKRDTAHTICLGCLHKHFRGTRLLERGECAVCNYFCICRLCLRDGNARSLAAKEYRDFSMTNVHSKTFSAYKLKQTFHLTMMLVEEDAKTLDIEVTENCGAAHIVEQIIARTNEYPTRPYEKVECSNCLMSIVNVFFRCEQCGLEICTTCNDKYSQNPIRKTLERAHGNGLKYGEWEPSNSEAPCVADHESEDGDGGHHRFVACRAMTAAALRDLAMDLDACKHRICDELMLTSTSIPKSTPCRSGNMADNVKRFEMHEFTDGTDESRERLLEDFHDNWQRARPVVVSNCRTIINWTPGTMVRMMRDLDPKNYVVKTPAYNCSTFSEEDVNIHKYFAWHEKRARPAYGHLWRLKDWPSDENFAERLPRLARDFVYSLPLQEYCFPWDNGGARRGMMNAAIDLPEACNRADLGPKSYISMGRSEERGALATERKKKNNALVGGGDAVTRIHCDMADAVNLLIHTSGAIDGENNDVSGGCAVWDIWRRRDRLVLEKWLRDNSDRFTDRQDEDVRHAIHDQCFYLTTEDKEALKAECGIEAYTFEQKLSDAVYIPAGCPHQVRNIQSCIKVALDFVSPESMTMCLALSDEFSHLIGVGDKIQIRRIIVNSFQKTLREVFPEFCRCPDADCAKPSEPKKARKEGKKRTGRNKVATTQLPLHAEEGEATLEDEKPIEEVKQQSIQPHTQGNHERPNFGRCDTKPASSPENDRRETPTMLSSSPVTRPSSLAHASDISCGFSKEIEQRDRD